MACVNSASAEQQLRELLAARLAGLDTNAMHVPCQSVMPNAHLLAAISSTSNSVNESRSTSAAHWQPAARNSHTASSHLGAAGAPVIVSGAGSDALRCATFTDLLCGDGGKRSKFAAGISAPLRVNDCFLSDAPFEDDSGCVLIQPAHTQTPSAEEATALPPCSPDDPLHINLDYLQELADFAESLKGQEDASTHANAVLPSAAAGMAPVLSNSSGTGPSPSEVNDLPGGRTDLQQSLLGQLLATQQASALRAAQRPAAADMASDRQALELAVLVALQARGGCNAPPHAAAAIGNGLGERLGSGTGSVSGDLLAGGDVTVGAAEGVWDSCRGDAGEFGAHGSSDESRAHGRMDVLKLKPRSLKERARRERIR